MNQKPSDMEFMERCVELAWKGYGWVHPNPLVGCVVVRQGKVVGEGSHRKFGGPHAEVYALKAAGSRARGATLYVNLEPCDHHGKTPPCVDAILRAGIRRVVVGGIDANPLVAGAGIRALRRGGVEVSVGVLRHEVEEMNERFLHFHRTGLPFVGLKWAQTLDGFAADTRNRSRWITTEASRKMAHVLRGGYDAVLVGAGTVLSDNPRLTVRHIKARQPVRVVLDGRLRIHGTERLFKRGNERRIVITQHRFLRDPSRVVRRLVAQGVDVIGLEGGAYIDPRKVVKALGGEGITSVLIEGGPTTTSLFVEASVWDKVHIFVAPTLFGDGKRSVPLSVARGVGDPLRIFHSSAMPTGNGEMLIEGYRKHP